MHIYFNQNLNILCIFWLTGFVVQFCFQFLGVGWFDHWFGSDNIGLKLIILYFYHLFIFIFCPPSFHVFMQSFSPSLICSSV